MDVLQFIDKNSRNEFEWSDDFISADIWFIRRT